MRGGLSYAVIFVGAILGAITGTVAASVIAMAVIALPLMMRYGYSTRHATGVIAASGTITQLIPPSLVLVVLADQLGQLGRRHVCRRDRAEPDPDRPVLHLGADREPDLAASRCRRCRRGAHAARLGAVGESACAGSFPRSG